MGFSKVYLWQDPTVTAPVFLSVLVTFVSVCYYSILSVFAYSALFVLGTATGVRLYVYVMNSILKKDVNDPLAKLEAIDPTVPEEKIQEYATVAAANANFVILELRRLFFIHDSLDSVKFGLTLWFLTYVGSWFNAMTLIVISWVGLFTLPKVYINNRKTLDPIVEKVAHQLEELRGRFSAFLPSSLSSRRTGVAAAAAEVETKKEE
jgi:hypothetical protein